MLILPSLYNLLNCINHFSFLNIKLYLLKNILLILLANSFVSLTLQRHLSSTSNKSSNENSPHPSFKLNNSDNDQSSTIKKSDNGDTYDEQMDDYKNYDNENSEKSSFSNMIELSPNNTRKSTLINQEQFINKENVMHQTKQNLKLEDPYSDNQKFIDKDDFDLNKSSNRKAIKKTRVYF
jgi:hypothetical protein